MGTPKRESRITVTRPPTNIAVAGAPPDIELGRGGSSSPIVSLAVLFILKLPK